MLGWYRCALQEIEPETAACEIVTLPLVYGGGLGLWTYFLKIFMKISRLWTLESWVSIRAFHFESTGVDQLCIAVIWIGWLQDSVKQELNILYCKEIYYSQGSGRVIVSGINISLTAPKANTMLSAANRYNVVYITFLRQVHFSN